MNLLSAFRVSAGDVVAFVGAGGKTTAMFRLANETAAAGGRVVTAATTRLWIAQTRLAPVHAQSLSALRSALDRGATHVLLTGEFDLSQDKALGVSPDTICHLHSAISNLTILVEADGARALPFKAPAEHEPAIPPCATLVAPMIGIDAIGRPLAAEFVHRPEQVRRICAGDTVTPEMAAAVLAHPLGGRKGVPSGARAIALINKVETEEQMRVAKQIAALLLDSPGIDGVVIGAAMSNQFIFASRSFTGAINSSSSEASPLR